MNRKGTTGDRNGKECEYGMFKICSVAIRSGVGGKNKMGY